MDYLSFEKPVEALAKRAAALRAAGEREDEAAMLDERATRQLVDIYARLTPWQRTQVARHAARPRACRRARRGSDGLNERRLPPRESAFRRLPADGRARREGQGCGPLHRVSGAHGAADTRTARALQPGCRE